MAAAAVDDAQLTTKTVPWAPADVLRLAVAVVALILTVLTKWLFGDTLVGFAADLLRGLEAVPQWMIDGFVLAVRLVSAVVLVAGLLLTIVRSGWRMLLTVG